MDIKRVELNLGQKSANPFKTTRKSNTNPFKYNDFEGNTIEPLVCADVLVSFKGKESKLKMISSSVIGSMTKLRNSITEPITNFVNKVKSAWNYAKNTRITIELPGIKGLTEDLHNAGEAISNILNYDLSKGISDKITGIGKAISEKMPLLNADITDLGKDLSTKWDSLIGKINTENKISSNATVAELKALWIKENELIKEVA